MPVPVIPCAVETITHPDGRRSVVVKPDILKLREAVGDDEADRILRATQGKSVSPTS